MHIKNYYAKKIADIINIASNITLDKERQVLYFRGSSNDYGDGAFNPSIYRDNNLEREHIIYREMQRFNEHEFVVDKTAFDKLSRMQHYSSPTRLLDISEDILSACYFALEKDKNTSPVIYILKVDKDKMKYYDSDSVSILSNLAKTPLENPKNLKKSKKAIWELACDYYDDKDGFIKSKDSAIRYLMHDIREEKSYFINLIDPKDFFSIFCVKPKYSNQRIHGQKGAFLLFGMNKNDYTKPLEIIKANKIVLEEELHPIVEIHKIALSQDIKLADLEKLGISKPYIYPELEKVSEYLRR